MKRLLLGTAAAMLMGTSPALARSMGSMPGMKMPAKQKPKPKLKANAKAKAKTHAAAKNEPTKPRAKASSTKRKPSTGHGHQKHGVSSMPGMTMAPGQTMENMPGMSMPQGQAAPRGQAMGNMPVMAMPGSPGMEAAGTNLPAGNGPPPPVPTDHAADGAFPPVVMDKARSQFIYEHGGQSFRRVLFNLAEYQIRHGRDGYRWDGEAWLGGDINRLAVKSEGEGTLRNGLDSAEVQALYSRAIGPYFNLQAGVRHDFQPSPARTYATVGVEGLAPYMFETQAALFCPPRATCWGGSKAGTISEFKAAAHAAAAR